jgi:hypothetical protein
MSATCAALQSSYEQREPRVASGACGFPPLLNQPRESHGCLGSQSGIETVLSDSSNKSSGERPESPRSLCLGGGGAAAVALPPALSRTGLATLTRARDKSLAGTLKAARVDHVNRGISRGSSVSRGRIEP